MVLGPRSPAVAGSFYPSDPDKLKRETERLLALEQNRTKGDTRVCKAFAAQTIRAVLVPHAGWFYSGAVAGLGFSLVQTLFQNPTPPATHVRLWGPSHHFSFRGLVANPHSAWEFPGGSLRCVEPRQFTSPDLNQAQVHANEHCLEVEIPFLAAILNNAVLDPVLFGAIDVREALAQLSAEDTYLGTDGLIVVSSDLSHGKSDSAARGLDNPLIEAVLAGDSKLVVRGEACGRYPLATLVELASQKGWEPMLVDYRTSADANQSMNSVVGYASVIWVDHA